MASAPLDATLLYHIRVHACYGGQQNIINDFHLTVGGNELGGQTILDLLTAFHNNWYATLMTKFDSNYKLLRYECRDIDMNKPGRLDPNVGQLYLPHCVHFETFRPGLDEELGTNMGEMLPPNCAVLVATSDGRCGRDSQSRNFFAPVPEADQAGGYLLLSAITGVGGWNEITNWLIAPVNINVGGTATFQHVHFLRTQYLKLPQAVPPVPDFVKTPQFINVRNVLSRRDTRSLKIFGCY
jgi:hypothetical protein